MTRVSVTSGNGKLTIEVSDVKAKKMRFETSFGTACRLIKEANKTYEKDGDMFEYLSRIQFAINLCSAESTRTLLKLVKYGN